MSLLATLAARTNLTKISQKIAGSLRSPIRRVVFGVLVIVLILYLFSSLLREENHRNLSLGPLDRCLDGFLRQYDGKITRKNAFIYHQPPSEERKEKYFLPYIGNGYIGASIDGTHGVWLKGAVGLDIPTDLNPISQLTISGYNQASATVLDIEEGRILKYVCYQPTSGRFTQCVSFTHTYYIHRTRPGLLMHEFTLTNPTDANLEVSVIQQDIADWAEQSSTLYDIPLDPTIRRESSKWQIGSKKLANQVLLTVAALQLAPTGLLELRAKNSLSLNLVTVFDYKILSDGDQEISMRERQSHTKSVLMSVLNVGVSRLHAEHTQAWRNLWSSGFSISDSKAPDTLNADVINSTLYYILSHTPSIINDVTSTPQEISTAVDLMNKPDSCYHNRHHTLQFSSLWQIGDTVERMNAGVDTHLKSLRRYGCGNYASAGVEGVLQAILLSLGGLMFLTVDGKPSHMEFNADPADLHRDYQFRNIRFSNQTRLNLSVIVDENNFAVLHISSSRPGFFATDAGFSTTVQLSSERMVTLPVKLTNPLSSILYVSNDENHLEEMSRLVQHKEVARIAPAHDHRIMALHKHGSSYGGLPFTFWVVLVGLIIVFHVFLIKLIIQEIRKPPESYRRRTLS